MLPRLAHDHMVMFVLNSKKSTSILTDHASSSDTLPRNESKHSDTCGSIGTQIHAFPVPIQGRLVFGWRATESGVQITKSYSAGPAVTGYWRLL